MIVILGGYKILGMGHVLLLSNRSHISLYITIITVKTMVKITWFCRRA